MARSHRAVDRRARGRGDRGVSLAAGARANATEAGPLSHVDQPAPATNQPFVIAKCTKRAVATQLDCFVAALLAMTVQIIASQIERRREDHGHRFDDAEGVGRTVGIRADGEEVRFPFVEVAHVELEAGADLVVEKARAIGGEGVGVDIGLGIDRAAEYR